MSGSREIVSIPMAQTMIPSNTAAAYVAGQQVGARMDLDLPFPFLSGDQGPIPIMQSLAVVDPDNQKAAFDLLFFSSKITDAGDHVAFAPSIVDAQAFIGRIQIVAADYVTYGARALAEKAAIAETMRLATATPHQMSVIMVTQGTPTYATLSGLRLKLTGIIS